MERLHSTQTSQPVFSKAFVQRIRLIGDRGEQRDSGEQTGTFDH
jgi:hypothetical protein